MRVAAGIGVVMGLGLALCGARRGAGADAGTGARTGAVPVVAAAPAKSGGGAAARSPAQPPDDGIKATGAAGPSWSFVVELADLAAGTLEITWSLRGFSGPLRVCTDLPQGGPFVRGLAEVAPAGPRPLERDGRCWRLAAAQPTGTVLRYRFDLRGLAAAHRSPDFAERLGETLVFADEAVLLRPDPLAPYRPRGAPAPIDVEFHVPGGVQVMAPFQPVPAGAGVYRFRTDALQYDYGSYVTVGRLHDLGVLTLPHTTVEIKTVDLPRRAPDESLRRWIEQAMRPIDAFYGPLLAKRMHVLLSPVAGSDRPGIFGTIMRRGTPSAVIYYGGDCAAPETADDWLPVHELFHAGNPNLDLKLSWFTEGFTTYYQDVLRARRKTATAAQIWDDLHDGMVRFCQPEEGRSLAVESDEMQKRHSYVRVYWGGACVALHLDAAIRERSGGRRSLDDVYRELRGRSLEEPLSEDEVIAALDEAAGPPRGPARRGGGSFVRALLDEPKAIDLGPLYQRLGLVPTGPTTLRLRDDAPLSAIRRAMF